MNILLPDCQASSIHEPSELHELGRNLIAAWNAHDARRVASYFADDYVGSDVALANELHGPRDVRRLVLLNTIGIPDLTFEVLQSLVDGNSLVLVWEMRGTHRGRAFNIPATGKAFRTSGVTVFQVRDGKVLRSVRIWDSAGMLRQFGLLPDAYVLPPVVAGSN